MTAHHGSDDSHAFAGCFAQSRKMGIECRGCGYRRIGLRERSEKTTAEKSHLLMKMALTHDSQAALSDSERASLMRSKK